MLGNPGYTASVETNLNGVQRDRDLDVRYSSLSVIVPTYNRSACLARLLVCLDAQTYPADYWNVIVVDDGSDDPGYAATFKAGHPYRLLAVQQNHLGAATARNFGAIYSQADILVFLDDDVIVEPSYLEVLVREHNATERAVIMGNFRPTAAGDVNPFKNAVLRFGVTQGEANTTGTVDFTYVVSHNLSIKRHHFYEIGLFQDPTELQGWPNWDDIDLAYRAYQQGFEFIQVPDAQGSHIDHVLDDFQAHCERIYRAGKNARWLFSKYPELEDMLPMFQDKTPIRLGKDPTSLVLRKILRRILAWKPILALMEGAKRILEKYFPNSRLLAQLYRWINSSYIYQGYCFGVTTKKPNLFKPNEY
jgi:glycosyltransferase involved in cell wall biosynthesis